MFKQRILISIILQELKKLETCPESISPKKYLFVCVQIYFCMREMLAHTWRESMVKRKVFFMPLFLPDLGR